MGQYLSRHLSLLLHRESDQPPSEGSVWLPPETVDKILGHVPVDEDWRRTLMACSLVATCWTRPSQRHLFRWVDVHDGNYEWWMSGVAFSGPGAHLLGYVRSLRHHRGWGTGIQGPAQDFGENLSGLRNLHSLTLSNIEVEHISDGELHTCFSAFRETLTSLSLDTFAMSFRAFVTLVDYFPNITTLRLHSFGLEPNGEPAQSLSRPLRGKVRVRVQADFPEFINRFTKLDLEYDELVIHGYLPASARMEMVGSALQISPSTVKLLRLNLQLPRE